MIETPVTRALDAAAVSYRVFEHPGALHSLEQAAAERNQRPEQVVRSILFRLGPQEFVMVLAGGSRQISWPTLRRWLGQSRLTMATEEEVLSATGYERGAVSPFGLPAGMRILLDRRVLLEDEISLGSGVRNVTVILKSADLRKALGNAEIGDFLGVE